MFSFQHCYWGQQRGERAIQPPRCDADRHAIAANAWGFLIQEYRKATTFLIKGGTRKLKMVIWHFHRTVFNTWSPLFSHLLKSAHQCRGLIWLQYSQRLDYGLHTIKHKSGPANISNRKGLFTRAIHYQTAPATPPPTSSPHPPSPSHGEKKKKKKTQRELSSIFYTSLCGIP